MNNNQTGLSEQNKTIITVLALIFIFPVGAILMFVWMKWPMWLKVLLLLPGIVWMLAFLGIVAGILLVAINPAAQMEKAEQVYLQETQASLERCLNACNQLDADDPFVAECITGCEDAHTPVELNSTN